MKIYFVLVFFITFFLIIGSFDRTVSRLKLIISFVLLFIYASIRVNGLDYVSYEEAYYEIQKFYGTTGFESRMEKGYVLLNYIMPSYRLLLVLLSGFTCFTYYKLFRRYVPSHYYWLGFILLALSSDKMFFFQISGLRNAIAINIMTLSIPFIIERKIKPYLALTILAYFFHNSVLFFMPLAYFVATPFNFKRRDMFIWASVFVFFIAVSATSIIDYATSFIGTYFERYSVYTEIAEESVYQRSILMYGFVLVVVYLLFKLLTKFELTPTENVLIKLSLLFFVSLVLGTLNIRMSQYFVPYLIAGCFVFLNRFKNPIMKYGYLAVLCLFLWYSLFIVYMGSSESTTYEYKTLLG